MDCLLFVCFSFTFSQLNAFNCYVHHYILRIGRIAYCAYSVRTNMQKWSQGGDVIWIVVSMGTNYSLPVPLVSKQSPCCQQNVMQRDPSHSDVVLVS